MNLKLAPAFALVLVTALWMAPLPHAGAVPLVVNGDFAVSADLDGWTATGNVVSEPTGAFAQLETDGSFQRTLEQTFPLSLMPARLAFDFAFSTSISDIDLVPPGIFFDSFAVSLLTDGGDWLDILVVDVIVKALPDPSDGIEPITGALPIDVGLDSTVTIPGFELFDGGFSTSGRVSLPLPASVLGQDVTLSFDLFDQDILDAVVTRAAIDNVAVELAAVPEPATLGLLVIGLAAAGVARRRRESSE
jgi:hypothetical protein